MKLHSLAAALAPSILTIPQGPLQHKAPCCSWDNCAVLPIITRPQFSLLTSRQPIDLSPMRPPQGLAIWNYMLGLPL